MVTYNAQPASRDSEAEGWRTQRLQAVPQVTPHILPEAEFTNELFRWGFWA